MEKRLFLAIALSMLILFSWNAFFGKPYPTENKQVTANLPSIPEKTALPANAAKSAFEIAKESTPLSLVEYSNNQSKVIFAEEQAVIKEVVFKNYNDYKFSLKYGFLLEDKALNFKKENSLANSVTFVHNDKSKKVIKRFIFSDVPYKVELELIVENLSNLPLNIKFPLVLGVLDFSANNAQSHFQDVFVATKEKTTHFVPKKDVILDEVKFIGMRERYFCVIVEPEIRFSKGFVNKPEAKEFIIGLSSVETTIPAGESFKEKFSIYLGPQDLRSINLVKPEWATVVNFGSFDFIAQILLKGLEFLHRLARNWGLAIILLSLLVYFLLYPLTLKQMRSVKEMQDLQPKIEGLRKLYKDNQQRLNKEIMGLYREHKVNPLGGCLPLILQMPIFFALYQTLMRTVALRGARFLWIKDLSEPDRLFTLPISLPLLGNEVNILPIVMAIGMFVQQKISQVATASTSAEQQKLMMIIMPIMFGIIFYHMPSGLVLYWFVNSVLMLAYQLKISKAK